MSKINFKGINSTSVAGVLILVVALVNAILQMFGFETLPISNDEVSTIVSSVFLIGSALYTTYKNFNCSTASQTAQRITDAIKQGEILAEDVDELIDKCKNRNNVLPNKENVKSEDIVK